MGVGPGSPEAHRTGGRRGTHEGVVLGLDEIRMPCELLPTRHWRPQGYGSKARRSGARPCPGEVRRGRAQVNDFRDPSIGINEDYGQEFE